MLTSAAVEGEVFTVQVVARLHDVNERQLLRHLSRTVGRRHRLVSEPGEVTVGQRTLSRFQFRHALFQQYLYNQLSPGERRLLHTDVAAVLEELYAGHTEEITVALARHYTAAGQGEKAIPHLLRAGDQARLAYAHESATEHYRQAVFFLKEKGDQEHTADTLMKLGLTYHNAFDFKRSRLAFDEAIALRQSVRPQPVVSAVKPPRTLKTTAEGEPDTLDPTLCADTTSGIIIGQLFSGLVTETSDMELVPDVAQRWEILEDGRKYIFHLRSDVTWSDGAPVTATDFEYAWKRVLRPATRSMDAHLLYDVKGASAFHQGQVSNPNNVGVSALDTHSLVVELERPASYFLSLLAVPITLPIPRHVVAAHGGTWTDVENIVTNGPFKLEAWRKGKQMSLSRNRAYHGQFNGNIARVEVFFSGDDLAAELAWYEAGRLDVARLPSLKREVKPQRGGEYITQFFL